VFLTRSLFIFLLGACGSEGEPPILRSEGANFAAVLETVMATPADAKDLCAVLEDPGNRGECLAAGAEAIAGSQPEQAISICESIESDMEADECFFQVSEHSEDRELCARAGRFEEDCQMHAWSRALAKAVDKKALPGEVEAEVALLAARHGFSEEDPRPWVALYRRLLGQMRPMDREICAAASTLSRQEICSSTGLTLFHDRLNYVRDRGLFPCDGGELPPELNALIDPELAAALSARREVDLCP